MLDLLQVFAHLEAQERVREQFDPAARGPHQDPAAVGAPDRGGARARVVVWLRELADRLERGNPYMNLAGVERGEWWPTGKLIDCDLDSVRNEPGWETVHADCLAMTQGASALPSCSSSDSFWSRN